MKKNLQFIIKEFLRSPNLTKDTVVLVFTLLLSVYFLGVFLFLGIKIPDLLEKELGREVLTAKFNIAIWIYLSISFIARFLLQKLPVLSIKPLLIQPVRRRRIAGFLIFRSLFTLFNIIPLLLVIPFFIKIILPAYSYITAISWLTAVISLILANHLLAVYLKWGFNEGKKISYIITVLIILVFASEYFGYFTISERLSSVIGVILQKPLWVSVFISVPALLYILNKKYIVNNLYLSTVSGSDHVVRSEAYSFFKSFGSMGSMLALETKLIFRNKRPRSVLIMSLMFIAYGLILYRHETLPLSGLFIAGFMCTSLFMISYGQFVPAWHSNYFSLFMVQNMPIKKLLYSSYILIAAVISFAFIISTAYAFFDIKYVLINFCILMYNLGINIPLLILAGCKSRKSVDINSKGAAFNYQGISGYQYLVSLPLLFLPLLLLNLFELLLSVEDAFISLGLIGVIGILFHSKLLGLIARAYINEKYKILTAYKNS